MTFEILKAPMTEEDAVSTETVEATGYSRNQDGFIDFFTEVAATEDTPAGVSLVRSIKANLVLDIKSV